MKKAIFSLFGANGERSMPERASSYHTSPYRVLMSGGRARARVVCVIVAISFGVLFSGCAAKVQSVRTDSSAPLRQSRRLMLVLTDATGSISVSGAAVAGIASGQLMKGEGQATQALNSLQFELAAIGFQMVGNLSEAQLVGEFSIGQIRHDPLAGWIADQAMLVLKDRTTGNTVALFRAKHGMATPTVNSLVSQIAKAVKQSY